MGETGGGVENELTQNRHNWIIKQSSTPSHLIAATNWWTRNLTYTLHTITNSSLHRLKA
jgi:hypothetical protein